MPQRVALRARLPIRITSALAWLRLAFENAGQCIRQQHGTAVTDTAMQLILLVRQKFDAFSSRSCAFQHWAKVGPMLYWIDNQITSVPVMEMYSTATVISTT